MKKTEQVKQFFAEGDFKKALRIAKNFRIGITEQQSMDMQMAYECMLYPDFYRQLGKDIEKVKSVGISTLRSLIEAKAI